ncbi:MAG TPA: LuxR C-terminal-related transcriptional regulator [Anaerolineaceae bacterium]|nr:LuxR C-terminal-related transcriptional regulator [Anaerolineaceae bacterium]
MTSETSTPLVLTKLRVPPARQRVVLRARLLDHLAADSAAGLILVCAPAGYGKTTLLADWARSMQNAGTAVAWYTLDASDGDPIPFGSYLIHSFLQALGSLPELTQIARRLRSTPEMDLRLVIAALINILIADGRNTVLILDDYHLIGAAEIHAALSELVERRPENLRIALGSRSRPPLPLARLRARGQMVEVRAADLRFSREETARFLSEVMQLDLPPQGIAALEQRTEGWAAGLQLAALSLSGHSRGTEGQGQEDFLGSFTGSHRYLAEYLLEEVIDRQPEEVQAFLLYTSVLERFCAELCGALVESGEQRPENSPLGTVLRSLFSSPLSIIDYLSRSNLFLVPLDEEGRWYRYHHLFRDFLRAQLKGSQPGRIPRLHRAACEWLAAKGFFREAAAHAFQAQDWDYAAAFVEQHSFDLIVHSDIAAIYDWCSAFPEAVIQRRPMLCVLQAFALALHFRRANWPRVEARLGQAEAWIASGKSELPVFGLTEIAAVVRTFLAMTPDPAVDPQELLALARRTVEAYPEGNPGRFTGLLMTGYARLALHESRSAAAVLETARQIALGGGLFFGVVESTFHLARLAYVQGQLNRSAGLCRQGQADIAALLAHPEDDLPALGCLDVALGCVLIEQDRLEEAGQRLGGGLEQMGWGMNPYYLFVAYVALFRLNQIQGRTVEASQCLDRLEEAWPDVQFCTRGLRAVHAIRRSPKDPGALAEAAGWCQAYSADDRAIFPPGMGPIGAAEAYYLADLAWAEAQIALGNPQAAREHLEKQLDLAETNDLKTRVIELALLAAKASLEEGDPPAARDSLRRALALAEPEGYLRIFDQGPLLARLMGEDARDGIHAAYIERILAAIAVGGAEEPAPTQRPGSSLVEPLSEREVEVLRLMARGRSNQAIAEELVVTVGTVKSHINHILRKLDAQNRTEAVGKGRRLGMIEDRD